MFFDIRDEVKAANTLGELTGLHPMYWTIERINHPTRIDFTDVEEDINRVISQRCGHFPVFDDLKLIVSHITTSENKCESILKNGIIDLRKAYCDRQSELRQFLDTHGVIINIGDHYLAYKDRKYDISYGECPSNLESEAYAAWSVGRKFYFDYCICGFLSISESISYGGNVHLRPEILEDIDLLLTTDFSSEWEETHEAYEIIFSIPISDVVPKNFDTEEMIMSYLCDAYICVSCGPDNQEILLKNGVKIDATQILDCKKFELWN